MQPVRQAAVRRAEAADHPGVAAALASAFADDPGFAWLLDFAPDRERRQQLFFRTDLRHLVPDRRQVWASEGGEAAAIWAPPGRWSVPPATVARESAAMVRVFRRRLPLALRYLIRIERSHPKEPHWYLNWLGAVPERQGQGLGSALLRPVLALCDRDRVGAYLESSSDRSAKLYERHGFRTVETFDMPGGGPPIRRMWRDPHGLGHWAAGRGRSLATDRVAQSGGPVSGALDSPTTPQPYLAPHSPASPSSSTGR